MKDLFFATPVTFQIGLIVAVSFFILAFVMMMMFPRQGESLSRRGCSMILLLYFSFVAYLLCCRLPIVNFYWHCITTALFYFLLLRVMFYLSLKRLARNLAIKEKQFYNSEFEIVHAASHEFTWLNLEFYDDKQHELESFGFQKTRDFENVNLSRAYPETRSFTRSLINHEKNIIAGITQSRYVKPQDEAQENLDNRIVAFRSEFSDGTFFITNNALGILPSNEIEGIVYHQFAPNTSPEEILETHKIEVEKICKTKNVEVVVYLNTEAMDAAGKRIFLLFCKNYKTKMIMKRTPRTVADNRD
jgi:hypothetical protein